MLHPKTDERVNPSVEMHHLVGKLPTAETLPMCNVTVLVMFVIRERLYAHPVDLESWDYDTHAVLYMVFT